MASTLRGRIVPENSGCAGVLVMALDVCELERSGAAQNDGTACSTRIFQEFSAAVSRAT